MYYGLWNTEQSVAWNSSTGINHNRYPNSITWLFSIIPCWVSLLPYGWDFFGPRHLFTPKYVLSQWWFFFYLANQFTPFTFHVKILRFVFLSNCWLWFWNITIFFWKVFVLYLNILQRTLVRHRERILVSTHLFLILTHSIIFDRLMEWMKKLRAENYQSEIFWNDDIRKNIYIFKFIIWTEILCDL